LYHDDAFIQLSVDHSYAQELVDNQKANNMTLEDIESHPYSNALTSFLGGGENIVFDQNTTPVKLLPGDSILVCSDGVYNALNAVEIMEVLQHSGAMRAAKELQNKVLDKQLINQDNLTAIVLRICAAKREKAHSFFSFYASPVYISSLAIVMMVASWVMFKG